MCVCVVEGKGGGDGNWGTDFGLSTPGMRRRLSLLIFEDSVTAIKDTI